MRILHYELISSRRIRRSALSIRANWVWRDSMPFGVERNNLIRPGPAPAGRRQTNDKLRLCQFRSKD